MAKYNSRYEYITENKVNWLKQFADEQADKIAVDNNIDSKELKNAGYMENILDVVNRKKKISVEEKVAKYREMAGLDMVENLEKEGGKEVVASRLSLSIRDKTAQDVDTQLMNNVEQFIQQLVKNRNGSIATPAILEQLEHYIKVNKEWLREHLEKIESIITKAREQFKPETSELPINDLARTDEPSKGEKESPLFLPPAAPVA